MSNEKATAPTEDTKSYGRWNKTDGAERWTKLYTDKAAQIYMHNRRYEYRCWGRGENLPFETSEHQKRFHSNKSWKSLAAAKEHADYALRCLDFSPYTEGNKLIAEFCGAKEIINGIYQFPAPFGFKCEFDEGGYVYSGESATWDLEELAFHKDCNWWHKAYSELFSIKLEKDATHVKHMIDLPITICNKGIKYAFFDLVSAIKYYNSVKTK